MSNPLRLLLLILAALALAPAAAHAACPCTIWPNSATPATASTSDNSAVELGVKFRSDSNGYIKGLRFYKGSLNTGTHVGSLWTRTGALLASATFTGETASGWQTVTLPAPVPITANTTYVASYHTDVGFYSSNLDFFATKGIDAPPLHALAAGVDGANGVYAYGGGGFPNFTFRSTNYWVDVVFDLTAGDSTPPSITDRVPASGATGVAVGPPIVATFSEAVQPSTVSMGLTGPGGAAVPGTTSYDAAARSATFRPAEPLAYSTSYTARVSGATDAAGNTMAPDSWSFTTSAPPPPPPDQGPGGPILLVSAAANAFTSFYTEILRNEGLNEFSVIDVSQLTAAALAGRDVVVLGEGPLSTAQAGAVSDFVDGGGSLIAMRPDAKLAGLLGLTRIAGSRSDGYLAVDTSVEAAAGITPETLQYHGTADRYALAGATPVATLYSDSTTATADPAVTLRSVGANGGSAATFTYDLARSVVLTRQGHTAWAGQERDGITPIRSDDQYFGGALSDWVDLTKVAIPQADEQQRLLANLIETMVRHRKPLPRFWYLPRALKAAIVGTGDDHANGGTAGRFDQYLANSPGRLFGARLDVPPVHLVHLRELAADEGQGRQLRLQGLRARPAPEHRLLGLHADELGVDVLHAAREVAVEVLDGAEPGDESHALPRLERLAQRAAHRALQRDPAGHELLLLARHLAQGPAGLHDRLRHADALQRHERRDGQRLPGRDPDDRRVQPELPVHARRVAGCGRGPEGLLRRVHDEPAHRRCHAVRERPGHGLRAGPWRADRDRAADADLARRSQRVVVQERRVQRRDPELLRGRRHGHDRADRDAADGVRGRPARVADAGRQSRELPDRDDQGTRVRDLHRWDGDVRGAVRGAARRRTGDHRVQRGDVRGRDADGGLEHERTGIDRGDVERGRHSARSLAHRRRGVTPALGGAHRAQAGRTYRLRVRSRDEFGHVSIYPAPPSPPATFGVPAQPTQPPGISAVRAVALPDGTASVDWETSRRADGRVQFGTSASALVQDRLGSGVDTGHQVGLTRLAPGRRYFYRVASRTPWGTVEGSPTFSFDVPDHGVADSRMAQWRMGEASGVTVTSRGDGELRLAASQARGTYTSRVLDVEQMVEWKRLILDADIASGTRLTIQVRSGSTAPPDESWSPWLDAAGNGAALPALKPSRYLQYRLTLTGGNGASPLVRAIGFTSTGIVLSYPGEVPG